MEYYKQHESNSNVRMHEEAREKKQVVCSRCMSTQHYILSTCTVNLHTRGNNWNGAKLQLFNLSFEKWFRWQFLRFCELINCCSCLCQLNSDLHYIVRIVHPNFIITHRVSVALLCVVRIDSAQAKLRHWNVHRRTKIESSPKHKWLALLMKLIKLT